MWARIDDQFYLNPKNAEIDRDEQDLFFAGIVYANLKRTDGFIPTGVLPLLLVWAKIPIEANAQAIAQAIAGRLLEHCYWELAPGGYQIHDFLDWNIPKADAEALHDARVQAGRRGGVASSQAKQANRQANAQAIAQASAQANGQQNASPNPIPIYLTTTKEAQETVDAFLDAGVRDFSNNIHMISSERQSNEIADRLTELYERRLFDWWGKAIKAAQDKNACNWAYMRGTLDNCLRVGTPPGAPRPVANGNGRSYPPRQAQPAKPRRSVPVASGLGELAR